VILGERVMSAVVTTDVTFREIGEEELGVYLASGDAMDKAGAYGIQGYCARWIPRIEGDYFNVVGLPVSAVVGMIEEIGE
jgi:septum formation protein